MTVGPDGAVYIADWYDIHLSHASPVNRSQWYMPSRDDGRIWRVAAKGARTLQQARETSTAQASPPGKPLSKLSPHEIVALLDQPNSSAAPRLRPFLGERADPGLVPAFR